MQNYQDQITKALVIAKNNSNTVDLRVLLMATSDGSFFSQPFVLYTAKMSWAVQKTVNLVCQIHHPPFVDELRLLNSLTKMNFKLARQDKVRDILYDIKQENPKWKKNIDDAQQKLSLPDNNVVQEWEENLVNNQKVQIGHVLKLDFELHNLTKNADIHGDDISQRESYINTFKVLAEGKLSEILLIDVIKLKAKLYPNYQPNDGDVYWRALQFQHQQNDFLLEKQNIFFNVTGEEEVFQVEAANVINNLYYM